MGKQVRAAALAVTAVTGVVVLGTITGCSSDDGPSSATTPSKSDPTSTSPLTPRPAPAARGVLTHSGYGPVRLGMSVADLRRSGAVRLKIMNKERSGCAGMFRMRSDRDVTGYVSWDHGVVAIFASDATRTVEGIRNGSTSAAARAAYPRARASANGWFARLSPKGAEPEIAYRFSFAHGDHGPVSDLFLQRGDEDCYE